MPRVVDKMRNYIVERNQSGQFNPGDRIPSYHELKNMFGTSYATVRSSMAKLQEEGLVDLIHGNGTYIAGTKSLTIEFYYQPTTIEFEEFKALLDKHIQKENLHLNVRLKDVYRIIDFKEKAEPSGSCKAVLVQCPADTVYHGMGLSSFGDYPDYTEVVSQLDNRFKNDNSVSIPFYAFSQQMAVNNRIMRRIGFNPDEITGDFKWWDKYIAACSKCNIIPASFKWPRNLKWPFVHIYNLLISLMLNEIKSIDALSKPQASFFYSSSGRKMLQVLRDSKCYAAEAEKDFSFYLGNSGLDMDVGSWITVQNKQRANVNLDDFSIVPFMLGNRKICVMVPHMLQTHFHSGVTIEEKNRVWKFVKLLISNEFQKELCSITGALSVRNDIKPEDYAWYKPTWAAFMPQQSDIVVSSIFDREMLAYFTALLEQFKFHDADADTILKCMDYKI